MVGEIGGWYGHVLICFVSHRCLQGPYKEQVHLERSTLSLSIPCHFTTRKKPPDSCWTLRAQTYSTTNNFSDQTTEIRTSQTESNLVMKSITMHCVKTTACFSTRNGISEPRLARWPPVGSHWMSLTSGTTWPSVSDLRQLKPAGATHKKHKRTIGIMESLASLRPSWCFEYSYHIWSYHIVTSCHISTEFASESSGRINESQPAAQGLTVGSKYVPVNSVRLNFGSPADWTAEEVQTNASSEPATQPLIWPQCCYQWGVSMGVPQ